MDKVLVTVIIAAYNAENFIRHAIDSVLAQTFKDYELIIVDDGSEDCTGSICDEYALKDNRIRVIHQCNGGVAVARQVGIDNAVGEYSIHFDADDVADSKMLEEMYATAVQTNADVVIADFYRELPDGNIIYVDQNFDAEKSSDVIRDILEDKLQGSLWNKLIRTSIYKRKEIRFIPGINYCEDVLALASILKDDDVVVVHHSSAYYRHCHNDKSITRCYDESKLRMRIMFLDELHRLLIGPQYKHALETEVWNVKLEAHHYGVIRLYDFESVYHNSIGYLLHVYYPRRLRLLLLLSSIIYHCNPCSKKYNLSHE